MRRALFCLLVAGVLVTAGGAFAQGARAPLARADIGVSGDDASDTFTGQGGLLLPATVTTVDRAHAAECTGCAWWVGDPCQTPYGMAFGGCSTGSTTCAADSRLRRVWWREPGAQWSDLGASCVGGGIPLTQAHAQTLARDAFVAAVPALAPVAQPARGAVTQIPVGFTTGQEASIIDRDVTLAGHRVHLTAQASWTWEFGDGARLQTDVAGAPWPALSVRHAYRRDGVMRIVVRATWIGQFTVDGLGPFPVREPVAQEGGLTMQIGQGRGVLVPSTDPGRG